MSRFADEQIKKEKVPKCKLSQPCLIFGKEKSFSVQNISVSQLMRSSKENVKERHPKVLDGDQTGLTLWVTCVEKNFQRFNFKVLEINHTDSTRTRKRKRKENTLSFQKQNHLSQRTDRRVTGACRKQITDVKKDLNESRQPKRYKCERRQTDPDS